MARQGFWWWSQHVYNQQAAPHVSSAPIFDTQPPAGSTVERLIGRITVVVALNSQLTEELTWPVFAGVQTGTSVLTPVAGSGPGYMGQEWLWWEMIHATATDVISGVTDPPVTAGRTTVPIDVHGKRVLQDPQDLRAVTALPGGTPGSPGYIRIMIHWRALILYP